MGEAKKLGKRETALLDRVKVGSTLCCEVDKSEAGALHNCRRWFLEPGGKAVGPITATKLVKAGLVRPNTSGLFHEFDAQTYVAAS